MKIIISFMCALLVCTAHAQFRPTAYDTNTDASAQAFAISQITSTARPKLTAPTTWFVATTGSDSNPGTNILSPLLTVQAGVDKALAYDFGTNNAIVQIADGKYEGTVVIKSTASTAAWQNKGGFLVLHGNDASPTSVVLTNSATNHLVVAAYGAKAIVASIYLTSTNRNNECLLDSQLYSYIGFSNVVLGACGATEAQLVAEANGSLEALGPYIVSGGGSAHALALGHGTIYLEKQVTFTNTPVFSSSVVRAYNGGAVFATGPFSGTVTAAKFNLATGGTISTFGNGSPDVLIPGTVNGTENLGLADGNTNYSALQTTLIITNVLGTNGDVDSLKMQKYGASTEGPSMTTIHSRGTTSGSHGGMVQDDKLFFLGGGGDDGTGVAVNKAVMTYNADGTWTTTSSPSYILFQTTSSGVLVRSNSLKLNSDHTIATYGFNTLSPGTISVTSSPMTYTTSGGHSEFVYINGGSVSSVTLNGTLVASGTNTCITVNLQNGESAVITYSVAPTSIKRKPY